MLEEKRREEKRREEKRREEKRREEKRREEKRREEEEKRREEKRREEKRREEKRSESFHQGVSCNCKINISLSYIPAIQKLYVTSTNPKHNHPIPIKNPKDSVIQEPHKSPSPLDDHHSEIEAMILKIQASL
ncbi:unnamed protein product [Gordionus sp. m RMFG-2023]